MTPRRAGGSGLLLLIVVVIAIVLLTRGGSEPGPFAGVVPRIQDIPRVTEPGTGRSVEGAPDSEDERVAFLRFVTGDIQEFWRKQFAEGGREYEPTQVIVFRGQVSTGCGPATSAVGPFYCPVDTRVYLDLGFFDELAQRFQAPGDFAQAYVIAHEIGHHLQRLMGVTEQVDAAGADDPALRNQLSIRVELMADCLAGVWAHSTYERGLLEEGDLEEGLRAAAAVGDDRIQAETQGRITPETWTHGSSAQRTQWLSRGFQSGDPQACDTFAATQA
jgi:predicted metalloprotease